MEYSGLIFELNGLYDYNVSYNHKVIGRVFYEASKIKVYYESNLIYEDSIQRSSFKEHLEYVAWEIRKELIIENKDESIYRHTFPSPKGTVRRIDFLNTCDDVCEIWNINDDHCADLKKTLERWLIKNGYDILMTR